MASIPYIDRQLPKDQQALADAASEANNSAPQNVPNSNASLNVANQAMNYGGYEYLAGAAAKELGMKYAMPKVAAVGTGTMTYAPHFAAFGGGYQLGKELDKQYNLSEKIADAVVPNQSFPAYTQNQKDLISMGYNVNKPIYDTSVQGAPTLYGRPTINREVIGYEKMKPDAKTVDVDNMSGQDFAASNVEGLVDQENRVFSDRVAQNKINQNTLELNRAMREIEANNPPVPQESGYEELFARRDQMSPEEYRLALARIAGGGNDYVERAREREAAGLSLTPDMDEYFRTQGGTVPLELAQARNEAGMQEVYSAPNREFETMYEKDGKMFGVLRDSDIRESFKNPIEMSEQDVNRFNQTMSATNAPIISGTPEAGLQRFKDRQGNIAYGNERAISEFTPQRPEAPKAPEGAQASGGLSPLADEILTDYAEFKESGEPLTADKQAQYEAIAGLTGRTFDPDTGFSNEFNPQIMENFQRRVDDGLIDTASLGGRELFNQFVNRDRRTSLQKATDEMNARQAESRRNYEANRDTIIDGSTTARTTVFLDRNQNGVDDRDEGLVSERNPMQMKNDFLDALGIDRSSDFGTGKIRVFGEMVDATPTNRALRDQEKAFEAGADELGLTGGAKRAYVMDQLRDRAQAIQDRATQQRMNQLNIQNIEGTIQSRGIRDQIALQGASKIETPTVSASALTSVQKFLDANGVDYDPETGALTSRNERFLLPDGKVDLSPNSPLVALLRGTYTGMPVEGAEAFLAPPPSVASQIDNILEGGGIYSSDGRFYVKENGKLVQKNAPKL